MPERTIITAPVPDPGHIGHAVADNVVLIPVDDWNLIQKAAKVAADGRSTKITGAERRQLRAMKVISLAYPSDKS